MCSNLLKLNFSPIFAVLAIIKSLRVPSFVSNSKASSTVFTLLLITVFKAVSTKFLNSSFLATKSVSELISTTAASFPSTNIAART